jgi:topoisomerase IV subunit B
VVNALSVAHAGRGGAQQGAFAQEFSRGVTLGPLQKLGPRPTGAAPRSASRPTGDFRRPQFKPARLFKLARSKAYLFAGVEIRWKCAPSLAQDDVPAEAVFQFPGGLADHLAEQVGGRECVTSQPFTGAQDFPGQSTGKGRVEWAIAWPLWSDGSLQLVLQHRAHPRWRHPRTGPARRADQGHPRFGELVGAEEGQGHHRRRRDDRREIMLSVFIRDPQFQSQTKDRLTSPEAARWSRTRCATISTTSSPTIWSAARRCSAR